MTVHVVTATDVGDPADHERDRRLPGGDADKASWSARTSTRWSRARASTTTAAARRRSSRSPSRSPKLGIKPRQKLRFAFWGAEESACSARSTTSTTLTDDAARQDLRQPQLRHGRLAELRPLRLRRRRRRDTGTAGPAGSAQIEEVFASYFASQGLATEPTAFDGRSDYGPFIAVGIPAGGLFSGAEGVKTAEQAAVYGGTAGVAYDPCYHQACDDINNLNEGAGRTRRRGGARGADAGADEDRLLPGRQPPREGPHARPRVPRPDGAALTARAHPQDHDGPPPGGPSHYCPAR